MIWVYILIVNRSWHFSVKSVHCIVCRMRLRQWRLVRLDWSRRDDSLISDHSVFIWRKNTNDISGRCMCYVLFLLWLIVLTLSVLVWFCGCSEACVESRQVLIHERPAFTHKQLLRHFKKGSGGGSEGPIEPHPFCQFCVC